MKKKTRYNNVAMMLLGSCFVCFGIGYNTTVLAKQSMTTVKLKNEVFQNLEEFKLQPALNVWAFSGDSTLISGQFLSPLYGDATKAFYFISEADYIENDGSWKGGLGAGYRYIINDHIYGFNAITDYVSTPSNGFYIMSPDIEVLSKTWDFILTGYVPLSDEQKLGRAGWAGETFGDYSYAQAKGHEYYDHYLQLYQEPAKGLDLDIARVIPMIPNAKLHIGGYYFNSRHSGENDGVNVSLEYKYNKYTSFELINNYDDKKHNQILFGIHMKLGGYTNDEENQYGLSTRLLDSVKHNPIVLTHADGVFLSNVKNKKGEIGLYKDLGLYLAHDNIWYFRSGSSSNLEGDGTAEHPFIGFTKNGYDVVYANRDKGRIDETPLMYFAPGSYNFKEFSNEGLDNRFLLPRGWGMFGRTDDYQAPAKGDQRPVFYGAMDMTGAYPSSRTHTTLNSIALINGTGDFWGSQRHATLYMYQADNVVLQNVLIKNNGSVAKPNPDELFYYQAMGMVYSSVHLRDLIEGDGENIILGDGYNNQGYGYGMFIMSSQLYLDSGVNNIKGMSSIDGNGDGLHVDLGSNVYFNGGINYVIGEGRSNTGKWNHGDGIHVNQQTFVIFNGGENHVTGSGTLGQGIYLKEAGLIINGGNNTITAQTIDGTSIEE